MAEANDMLTSYCYYPSDHHAKPIRIYDTVPEAARIQQHVWRDLKRRRIAGFPQFDGRVAVGADAHEQQQHGVPVFQRGWCVRECRDTKMNDSKQRLASKRNDQYSIKKAYYPLTQSRIL